MSKGRIRKQLLAGLVFAGGAGTAAAAQTTPAEMLQFQPRQPGVTIATSDGAGCKVDLVKGQKATNGKTPSGWLLKDASGRLLRRFVDSDGDGRVDTWSYYLENHEVYREIDSNFNGTPDQFRWLGSAGTRWGVDQNEDGRIDAWKAISPEEVSQEVLQATVRRDFGRIQALLMTKADLDALELPESEAAKIRESVAQAGPKFQKTTAQLIGLNDKTSWVHVELAVPQCVPGDALGSKHDLVKHKHGSVLYQNGEKTDWLQTGEMIQVGKAWKLVGAPTPGSLAEHQLADAGTGVMPIDPALKPLVEELRKIDEQAGKMEPVQYNLARAGALEQIIAKAKAEDRETWVKQLADSLNGAAQAGNGGNAQALERLKQWKDHLTKTAPNSSVAAYLTYREMSAEYAAKLAGAKGPDMGKIQDEWREKLKGFVEKFPAADDAPEALMQLGMVSEFLGKETEAKNFYAHLSKHFAKSPMAAKAAGAVKRLSLDGKEIELAGPTLGSGTPFDVARLQGKTVIIYYWASWNPQCATDFAKIKGLLGQYGSKGVELVSVNLDASGDEALQYLQKNPVPGTHLHQAGGLESPLAVNYGVMVLPNVFVVGRDGKVASRNAQVATLEDDLKKLLGDK